MAGLARAAVWGALLAVLLAVLRWPVAFVVMVMMKFVVPVAVGRLVSHVARTRGQLTLSIGRAGALRASDVVVQLDRVGLRIHVDAIGVACTWRGWSTPPVFRLHVGVVSCVLTPGLAVPRDRRMTQPKSPAGPAPPEGNVTRSRAHTLLHLHIFCGDSVRAAVRGAAAAHVHRQ
jgi:hypothetical protein